MLLLGGEERGKEERREEGKEGRKGGREEGMKNTRRHLWNIKKNVMNVITLWQKEKKLELIDGAKGLTFSK